MDFNTQSSVWRPRSVGSAVWHLVMLAVALALFAVSAGSMAAGKLACKVCMTDYHLSMAKCGSDLIAANKLCKAGYKETQDKDALIACYKEAVAAGKTCTADAKATLDTCREANQCGKKNGGGQCNGTNTGADTPTDTSLAAKPKCEWDCSVENGITVCRGNGPQCNGKSPW